MQDSSMNEICHNVGGVYKQTIEGTNQVLDMNELEKAVDYIDKANIIDLFAVGDSFLSALMFEHKMTYVNKFVNLKIIPTEQTQQALHTTKNSVALIISYSGQTNEIKPIVERIKINGGTIIAITSLNDSYLRKKADICLTMCSKENIINNKIINIIISISIYFFEMLCFFLPNIISRSYLSYYIIFLIKLKVL